MAAEEHYTKCRALLSTGTSVTAQSHAHPRGWPWHRWQSPKGPREFFYKAMLYQPVSHLHLRDTHRQWELLHILQLLPATWASGISVTFWRVTEISTAQFTDSSGLEPLGQHGLQSQNAWLHIQTLLLTRYHVTLVKLLDLSMLQFPHL